MGGAQSGQVVIGSRDAERHSKGCRGDRVAAKV
jgi:hypothetical protein